MSDLVHPEMMPLFNSLEPTQQYALLLVLLCQHGHGYDLGKPVNRRVAISWWSEFLPARVKLAAMTCSSLAEFSSVLAARLRGQIGAKGARGVQHREAFGHLLSIPEEAQKQVLDVLERQAPSLVTMVRAILELEKRDGKEDSRREEAAERTDDDTGGDEQSDLFPAVTGEGVAG